MGRTNKLVDGCYSFWQGGLFPLLQRLWPDYLAQTRIPGVPSPQNGTCSATLIRVSLPSAAALLDQTLQPRRVRQRCNPRVHAFAYVPRNWTSCSRCRISGGGCLAPGARFGRPPCKATSACA